MFIKLLKHIYQQHYLRYQIKQGLISSFSPAQWNIFQLYIYIYIYNDNIKEINYINLGGEPDTIRRTGNLMVEEKL